MCFNEREVKTWHLILKRVERLDNGLKCLGKV
jgi:hypothetical protein